MELRNASVKLPADLHQQIKDELEAKNITMSQFFEMAAKEHFDKEKSGKTMANGRTLAFTVSEELFQRVKEYLAWYERTYHRRLETADGCGDGDAADEAGGEAVLCAPESGAQAEKQPERTRIPQSAKQRRTAKKVHTMLKNFAEKAIRRDTKHNGRKATRRMAKNHDAAGLSVCQRGIPAACRIS
ncbi:MAG: hypothetical protein ACLRI7_11130 [Ruthenibacterium lactatiformans]